MTRSHAASYQNHRPAEKLYYYGPVPHKPTDAERPEQGCVGPGLHQARSDSACSATDGAGPGWRQSRRRNARHKTQLHFKPLSSNRIRMRWQSGLGIAFIAALSSAPIAARAQADDPYLRTIQVLRKTVLDQERLDRLATNPPPPRAPAFEALEKQYLGRQAFRPAVPAIRAGFQASAGLRPAPRPHRPPTARHRPSRRRAAATNATAVAAAVSPPAPTLRDRRIPRWIGSRRWRRKWIASSRKRPRATEP